MGAGTLATAGAKQIATETAVAVSTTKVSESAAKAIVATTVAGGRVASEVLPEVAGTTTDSMIKNATSTKATCVSSANNKTGGC
jgi:hypothetical protein